MKNYNFKLMTIAMIAIVSLYSLSITAIDTNFSNYLHEMQVRQKAKPVRPFHGKKPWGHLSTGTPDSWMTGSDIRRTASTEPSNTFEGLSYYDFLEAPDGTTWFYTAEYDIEKIEHSEYWTEENIVGYTFTIYDSSFQLVGSIKDKITLADGETRVAHAVLDPSVSKAFFNTDSKTEVMVYLAMNTSADFGYEVHYYNKVYSIGGEKDGDGNDVCIATMPGRCVDTFNAAADSDTEDCYYTFVEDIYPDPDDFGFDDYVGYLNAAKTQVTVYSKAAGEAAPAVFMQKDIYKTRYPGDTTDGIYMITKAVGGTPYFIFSQYEKPYFVDPTGMASDESATKDNSFIIEVYNGTSLVSTTKIPVEINDVAGEINYTFYSIGSVAWKDDIDMSVNGTPQAPAFLVSRDFTKASNLEEVASSYDIYGNDGRLIHNLAANADGIVMMNAIAGREPQALFVTTDGSGQYTFNFIDLYSGTKVLSLQHLFNGNPDDALTASCQRMAVDDFGSYQYAFEMQYDEQDTDGNDIKRIAWFGHDGSLARIDRINMGKNVMYATVNMYAESLSPYLYDNDDAMEYAVLVKRASGNTTNNEFIVVDDNGEWYAHFSDADGKGAPFVFSILPGADKSRLQMVYRDDDTYNVYVYDLPFDNDGAASIEGDWEFSLNGHYLGSYSLGEFIETFTATLDGNTVTFASSGSQYNIVATLTAENTLTFNSVLVGNPAATFGLWQSPYVNATGANDIEELTEETFTATYDPEAGTITFVENSGLRYGYFNNETGAFSYWDDAFDFVTAKKAATTGIGTVNAETENVDAIYYDLNGRRVIAPKSGLYIKKTGSKVQKVVVK